MGASSYFFYSGIFCMTGLRIHGGPDAHGVPLYDFSTNSNACGPCPQALLAVNSADLTTYPDSSYAALRAQLAAFHQVNVERIVLAASASEFIFRITSLLARSGKASVWLPPHAYGDYAQAALAYGLPVAANAGAAQLVWSCDPSSPTGAAHAGLQALTGALKAPAIVVLDRAYEPLRLGAAITLTVAQLQTVWQLWTPNKALGLTGVRAAYAIAPHQSPDTAAMEARCPSWPLGAHGVAMLQVWTSPSVQTWLVGCLDLLREWKARQIALCESMGWTTLPSDANFFCAMPALPPGLSLPDALARLRAQGIKLRDTTSFGLPDQVRLGVLPPDAQDALHNRWLHIVKGHQ
jgi:histidinol-phosphate aminotransferase